MTKIKVDISDLKSEGRNVIEELVEFLDEKTEAEVEAAIDEKLVEGDAAKVSRRHLRMLLRKFLHKQELKSLFRIIGGRENSWIVKKKRTHSEE